MTVKIYGLEGMIESGSIIAWREISLNSQSSSAGYHTPQAMHLFSSSSKSYFLCAASNGDLLVFDWETLGSDVYIGSPSRFSGISELPLSFCSHPFENYLVAVTDRTPVKLFIGPNGLEFEPILLEKVVCAAPLPLDQGYLMALNHKMLAVVQLDLYSQTLTERYHQKHLPCKIAFDPTTQGFLVVTASKLPDNSVKSVINLVDPTTNQILAAKVISELEIVECLTVWNVKKRRYICFGTSGYRTETCNSGGRVIIFTLKDSKGKGKEKEPVYKFYALSDLIVSQGVTAISPADNYLFAACGAQLAQIKINAETKHIMLGAKISSRNPAKSIKTTPDYDLFVAGSKDSLCHFRFDREAKRIRLVSADSIPKQAIDVWSFSEPDDGTKMAVCIFKSGAIAGYRCGSRKLELLFHFSLPGSPLKNFPMAILKQPTMIAADESDICVSFQGFDIPWDQTCKDALIVVTKSNARCSLLRISTQMYRFLKEMQDIMQAHPATRPILGGDITSFESGECGIKLNALNADFLAQFLELSDRQKNDICSRLKAPVRFDHTALVSQGERSLSNVYLGPSEVETVIYRLYRKLE